jgi:hypothetical protein
MKEHIMRDEYDFSNAVRNPYAKKLQEQAIVTLEPDVYQAMQHKAIADNQSLQQEINQTLRHHIQNQSSKLEDLIRKIIREELHSEQNIGRA